MLHGAVYVSIFILFFLYNLAADAEGHWPRVYLTMISIVATVWVMIKIVFRKNTTILMTSSFELLMVFLSWFLPFVLFKELRLPSSVVDAGRLACLQVIPFILATKIYFNTQPRGNKWVVGILSGATVLIALRGLVA